MRKARDRAGALAHGLKTPLTILAGEVRRLERRGETRGGGEDQRPARPRSAAMSTASWPGPGPRAPPPPAGASTHAAATVDRLIRLMRHMPRGEAIDWRNEVPDDLVVRIDPDDFGEVVGNLLDNARKWAKSARRGARHRGRRRRRGIAVSRRRPGLCRTARPTRTSTAAFPAIPTELDRARPRHRPRHPVRIRRRAEGRTRPTGRARSPFALPSRPVPPSKRATWRCRPDATRSKRHAALRVRLNTLRAAV